jgi:hypothetical protein
VAGIVRGCVQPHRQILKVIVVLRHLQPLRSRCHGFVSNKLVPQLVYLLFHSKSK